MSLDVAKLQNVRKLEGGIVQARCPACAEGGHDRTGEHLRVYPDGRYGCCVHPKDGNHRKRIFALAGDRNPKTFGVRIKHSAGSAVRSVKAALAGFRVRTLRTPVSHSVSGGQESPPVPDNAETLSADGAALAQPNSRTLRTPISNPYAYGREGTTNIHTPVYTCKDSETGVLSVLAVPGVGVAEPPSAAGEHLPYLTPGGTLVIPSDSPERYHWWKPPHDQRLRVKQTLAEVNERMKQAASLAGGNPKSEDRRPKAEGEEEYYGDGV